MTGVQTCALPIDVLLLAGHQGDGFVWGSQEIGVPPYYQYSSIAPFEDDNFRVQIRGYREGEHRRHVLRAGPFDVMTAFKTCRLLVVFACAGATLHIRKWRECIKKARNGKAPYIFGFYGKHLFPRDADNQFLSIFLWENLAGIAPGTDLDFFENPDFFDQIDDAWFDAINRTFPMGSKRRHLFFSPRDAKGRRGPRGAAVVRPNGDIFHVDSDAGHVKKLDEPFP